MQLKQTSVPFCMLFAPMGPSEPVRCSGLVVCAAGALLRRKRERERSADENQPSAARGENR